MNLFITGVNGDGDAYRAPGADFISVISLFSRSLPWDRFKKYFSARKLLALSADEQLMLLRFLAAQEILCLDDEALLRWLKQQFYLFSFLQPDYKARLPTLILLQQFRSELESTGLLEPFRKHCQHIIQEHGKMSGMADNDTRSVSPDGTSHKNIKFSDTLDGNPEPVNNKHQNFSNTINDNTNDINNDANMAPGINANVKHYHVDHQGQKRCENCGSYNVIKVEPLQEASSLPDIRFLRCRFCGHTFRA